MNPRDRRVVIIESILCPSHFRETLTKVFFKQFEVKKKKKTVKQISVLLTMQNTVGKRVNIDHMHVFENSLRIYLCAHKTARHNVIFSATLLMSLIVGGSYSVY